MKRTHCIGLLAGVLGMLFVVNISAIAHEKVVAIPVNSSSNKMPSIDKPCDSSTAGIVRWTGDDFEGCNGKAWTSLTPVPTVYSSGHEWMDRNLGASRIATGSMDVEAYGDLYQWGRFSDGHEKRRSSRIADQSTGNVPGHDKFIIGNKDWRSIQNNDLWQSSGINNPCPAGFRIPTDIEWEAERLSWGSNDSAGAFSSPLKLVMAGHRLYTDGTVNSTSSEGYYWSSTTNGVYASFLLFRNSTAHVSNYFRAFGYSVRCLKD